MKTGIKKSGSIIVFAICLVGLLICQFIWITGAMTVTNKQFEQHTTDALNAFKADYDRIIKLQLAGNSQNIAFNANTPANKKTIDSLLAKHCSQLNYTYQILPSFKTTNDAEKIGEQVSKYFVSLSPSSGSDDAYTLHLFAYQPKWYAVPKLWIWLLMSSGVIAISALSFLFMVRTNLRQTRLAEVQADFIHNIAHELKTPIATISMSCKTLKQAGTKLVDMEKISRYAGIVDEENIRIKECVDSLLEMLTVQKQSLNLNKEWININEQIAAAVETFKITKTADFQLSLDKNLPAVFADKMHIRGVIDNLIDNAIKYSLPDNISVFAATRVVDNQVEICIRDKGKGIAPKDLKFVFDKFYRASRTINQNVKGFGLGLYYVNQVAEAHNGKPFIKSILGKGSEIGIRIPIE